mgnify:CR=1 FL=1
MKNSITGPAEREQKDIQTKINIVIGSINKYKQQLLLASFDEQLLNVIRASLKREESNLQKLKDKYPEHFI